ncbi:DciA family protein [uncultured Gulosibacter sp.]|uniref:DUF721 domain-containing protein n=1 Tax=uncultured Gulosibacter sp. TaxID=1339167 RepID=UPI00288B745F|nr:DciA family protein [uncultured Gulosibacter sp.]
MTEQQLSESTVVWLRLKEVFGGQTTSFRRRRELAAAAKQPTAAEELPFGPRRDPVSSGDVLASLFRSNGWDASLAQAEVLERWPEIVGDRVAQHARALYINEQVLVVQCDSTAWATQLRLLCTTLVAKIAEEIPAADVTNLKLLNPGAPSWRYGKWSTPGRGPRDTYG